MHSLRGIFNVARVLYGNDKGSVNQNIHRHYLRDAIVVPLSSGKRQVIKAASLNLDRSL